MSKPPLPDVIERACAWLRSLQFGQPDAYNCADLLEEASIEIEHKTAALKQIADGALHSNSLPTRDQLIAILALQSRLNE